MLWKTSIEALTNPRLCSHSIPTYMVHIDLGVISVEVKLYVIVHLDNPAQPGYVQGRLTKVLNRVVHNTATG